MTLTRNCEKKKRETPSRRIAQRLHGPPHFSFAGQADNAIPQRFVFEQNEHQQHQNQAGLADRAGDQGEQTRDGLGGGQLGSVDFDRDRFGAAGDQRSAGTRRRGPGARQSWRHRAQFRFDPGKRALGQFPDLVELGLDGGAVLRQVGGHGDDLRCQHDAYADDANAAQQNRYQRGGQLTQPGPGDGADQRRDNQAEHQRQGQRLQHFAAEVEQRQDAGCSNDGARGHLGQCRAVAHCWLVAGKPDPPVIG